MLDTRIFDECRTKQARFGPCLAIAVAGAANFQTRPMDRARFPETFENSPPEPAPHAIRAPRNICAGNPPRVGLRIGPRHFTVPFAMHAPRWVTLGLLLLNQCGGPAHDTALRRTLPHPAPPASAPLAGLPALVLAQVPPGTQGPVVAHFDDRSLAVSVGRRPPCQQSRRSAQQPRTSPQQPRIAVRQVAAVSRFSFGLHPLER